MSSLSINEIETHLKRITDTIQRQNVSHGQLQTMVSGLQQQVSSYKNQTDSDSKQIEADVRKMAVELKSLADSLTPRYKSIEDIPGIRVPKWYEVLIDFDSGDNAIKTKSIEINPEGPFVITQITPVWEILGTVNANISNNDGAGGTVAAPINRIVPCTAFPMIAKNLGVTNTAGTGYNTPSLSQLCNNNDAVSPYTTNGPLSAIPEFSFQIEIGGSGRYWTNGYIPAAAFFGYNGQPLYLATQGWVERTDRVIIHAKPGVNVPSNGRVRFSMHGYQILGHISISEALGY